MAGVPCPPVLMLLLPRSSHCATIPGTAPLARQVILPGRPEPCGDIAAGNRGRERSSIRAFKPRLQSCRLAGC
ncbi:hypothetical protein V8C35DRAFT_291143 [Trichoderma chlorosporum]